MIRLGCTRPAIFSRYAFWKYRGSCPHAENQYAHPGGGISSGAAFLPESTRNLQDEAFGRKKPQGKKNFGLKSNDCNTNQNKHLFCSNSWLPGLLSRLDLAVLDDVGSVGQKRLGGAWSFFSFTLAAQAYF
jgi:hypothetical protein